MFKRFLTYYFLIVPILYACTKSDNFKTQLEGDKIRYPKGFPVIEFPSDNAYSKKKWALGKRLFYDPTLSIDSTVSCSSCHMAQYGFSDKMKTSPGVYNRPGTQNTPSLANVAYHPYYTRAGGVPSLEMQVLVPIQEHNEFDFNIVAIQERLQNNSEYSKMSFEAYNRDIDYFTIVRALATFERSLISGNSAYDKYEYQGSKNALSSNQISGMALFYGKANCSSCHSGFNFTNYSFESNGIYKVYSDNGRQRLTQETADNGKFKVPTLRNIEVTGPYMHDGSMASIDEVIEHYNKGGKAHVNKSRLIKPLGLSSSEKDNLKAFLLSLSDHEFLNNKENYK